MISSTLEYNFVFIVLIVINSPHLINIRLWTYIDMLLGVDLIYVFIRIYTNEYPIGLLLLVYYKQNKVKV